MTMSQKNSISNSQKWAMYVIAASFYFYDFILKLIPSIMMENIIERLSISTQEFGYVELSFYAIYTPMQLLCGPLLDEYGQRKILPSVIAVCLIGSIISALTTNYTFYIIARLLIGMGSAFAFVTVLKIASEWLPKKIYPLLAGLTTTFGMLGGIVSESIAPLFNQYDQIYFYSIIVVIGSLLLIGSICVVKDREDHEQNGLDLGLILNDIKQIMKKKQVWIAGTVGMCMFSPIQLFIPWAISFFAHDLGTSELVGGNIASLLFWGACVFAPILGWIAGKIEKKRNLLFLGNVCSLAGMTMILYSAQTNIWTSMLLMFITGIGVAIQPLVFVYSSREVDLHLTATAVAITNFIINLSSLIQPYIGNQLIEVSKQVYSLESWRNALSIIPIMLLVNCLLIYMLKEIKYDKEYD
ncbi:MAG: MFS transporter [Pseudomonadota bacterium]|nr:MFS transporter [Pseudomonadota bacterium]